MKWLIHVQLWLFVHVQLGFIKQNQLGFINATLFQLGFIKPMMWLLNKMMCQKKAIAIGVIYAPSSMSSSGSLVL